MVFYPSRQMILSYCSYHLFPYNAFCCIQSHRHSFWIQHYIIFICCDASPYLSCRWTGTKKGRTPPLQTETAGCGVSISFKKGRIPPRPASPHPTQTNTEPKQTPNLTYHGSHQATSRGARLSRTRSHPLHPTSYIAFLLPT